MTLDKINRAITGQLKLNQWENTKKVIACFIRTDEKPIYKFVQFDIKKFYPSIKEPLLEKALIFAEEYIDIPTEDKVIIKHAQKSLQFNKSETWMKKESGLFDIAMGAFDGGEVCEIAGSFILHKLSEKYKRKNLNLYHDDGLEIYY